MSTPSPAQIRTHIEHLDAAMAGIEDAIEIRARRQALGKPTDTLNPIRQLRLNGFREIKRTLEWLLAAVERKAAA
jgi:hypothetical protein